MEAEKEERDCVIGLDFGSHCVSLALWFSDKSSYEVFADELGSRVIPSVVAYRGEEIIVGQAALAQLHKNPSNTFLDVREIILSSTSHLYVPVLDKEIPVQELVSHFFRNIHNQVKQQVGKIVRECIVCLPRAIDEDAKARLIEAAQAGGIRIKSLISDAASTLMAFGLDDPALKSTKAVVVDMGWSESTVSVFSVSQGLFFPVSSAASTEICGKVLVKLLSEHCAKDFQRRSKVSCMDSSKSMTRLRAQCEDIMKHLSTGQEASVDIDSLFEGIDYSGKISRARFEDLAGVPLMRLKALIVDTVTNAGMNIADVGLVCLAGGVASIPKVISTIKSLFPTAVFPKGRFESAECLCVGAALHGRVLLEQGMLDNAPAVVPSVSTLANSIDISSSGEASDAVNVISAGTVLPAKVVVAASVNSGASNYFKIFSCNKEDRVAIGEIVFPAADDVAEVEITVEVDATGVRFGVTKISDGASLASLHIPTA